jgi:hypothetical protein
MCFCNWAVVTRGDSGGGEAPSGGKSSANGERQEVGVFHSLHGVLQPRRVKGAVSTICRIAGCRRIDQEGPISEVNRYHLKLGALDWTRLASQLQSEFAVRVFDQERSVLNLAGSDPKGQDR